MYKKSVNLKIYLIVIPRVPQGFNPTQSLLIVAEHGLQGSDPTQNLLIVALHGLQGFVPMMCWGSMARESTPASKAQTKEGWRMKRILEDEDPDSCGGARGMDETEPLGSGST